jgi:hypothetical protein
VAQQSKTTIKQEREQRRQEKIAALKKEQAKARRNRIVGGIVGAVAGVGVLALVITFVVTNGEPERDPDSIEIAGLETFDSISYNHVEGVVDYAQTPPVGGDHNQAWLNCGVYSEPQQNENAVHALEHGAVWVTYDPTQLSQADVDTLVGEVPDTYMIVSPWDAEAQGEALPSPVVASSWSAQVALDGVDDPRLGDFVERFWRASDVPEPGARCDGAITGPGLVS